MIEPVAEAPVTPRRSPVAAVLGVLSVALLGASFVWAHHWGLRTDTLVAGWAVATIGSLWVWNSLHRSWDLWLTPTARWLARIGLAGGLVSIVALAMAGLVYAAGINPTGACGGG